MSSSYWVACPLNIRPLGRLETSVNNNHSTIRDILEEKMPQFLHRIGNLKWRWQQIFNVILQLSAVYIYLVIYLYTLRLHFSNVLLPVMYMKENINNWQTIPKAGLIFEFYDIKICTVTFSDIFINCSWVVTRWQYIYTQTIHITTQMTTELLHKRCRPSVVLS